MTSYFLSFQYFLTMWFICEFFQIVTNLPSFLQYIYWKKVCKWIHSVGYCPRINCSPCSTTQSPAQWIYLISRFLFIMILSFEKANLPAFSMYCFRVYSVPLNRKYLPSLLTLWPIQGYFFQNPAHKLAYIYTHTHIYMCVFMCIFITCICMVFFLFVLLCCFCMYSHFFSIFFPSGVISARQYNIWQLIDT